MKPEELEKIIEGARENAEGIIDFGKDLWKGSTGAIRPMMHQIVRIHQAAKNGTKRMLLEDTTSAGKTLTAVAIKGLIDKERINSGKSRSKAIVIAPDQAIHSAWSMDEINKYTSAMNLPIQNTASIDEGTPEQLLSRGDFILVNYDKLSRNDTEGYTNQHLRNVRALLPRIDQVIVDESHNLKNIGANRTQNFVDIVEATKDKRFLMLSASAIPNRIKDAGFLLYMLDPVKFRHYADHPFDYTEDRFSIRNARNSGNWFVFTRSDLKELLGLPDIIDGDSSLGIGSQHRFEMDEESAKKYFDIWKKEGLNGISRIAELSQLLLRSEIGELGNLCGRIAENNPKAQIAIYSFYKEGFSREMAEELSRKGLEAAIITGDSPEGSSTSEKVKKRLELARRFQEGDIRALVNTISTVSESISLTTGDRPAYIIFAEPPIVPANFMQAIGRVYRLSQKAPVHVIEMIPTSPVLADMMTEHAEEEKEKGVRFRSSWKPTTVFEDKSQMRKDKYNALGRVINGNALGDLIDVVDVAEGSQDEKAYPSLIIPKKTTPAEEESEDRDNANREFKSGVNAVRGCIGYPIDKLTSLPERRHLISVYDSDSWAVTSSADTNKAIVEMIRAIEENSGEKLESILDWGCGTACLARTLQRPITNLDAMSEMLEAGKQRCAQMGIYSPEKISPKSIDDFFVLGKATEMPFTPSSFDMVSSGYALQYNAQGSQHKRDVEKILLETNRVMKPGAYGILALPNQATTPEDFNALKDALLPAYGFDVVFADDEATGHAVNKETNRENKVFKGVYLILYRKRQPATEYAKGGEDIFVFPPYKRIGIGGRREICFEPCAPCTEQKKKGVPSETFKTSEGVSLYSGVLDALRKYHGDGK